MSLRCCVLLLAASIPLSGCSTFGDGSDDETSAATTEAAQGPQVLTSECARLKPLFAPGKAALTHDEFEAALHAEFQKWDKDGNGELTQSELDPLNDMLRAMNVGASPVTDWNGDGHVDFTEFASGWRTMFQLCDTNRDKIISFRELGISPNVTPPREEPKKPPEGASQSNPDSM